MQVVGETHLLRQLLLGIPVCVGTILIHALVMEMVVSVTKAIGGRSFAQRRMHLSAVMIPTVLILTAAHLVEVVVWSLAYALVDVVPDGVDRVYFAFVNYTTLGYGDVLPKHPWQLLGPLTTMNGILLSGWSTAVIFEVLRRALLRLAVVPNI